jgi:hypothetical protein
MTDRPEWVHCALTGRSNVHNVPEGDHGREMKTWCGKEAFGFNFVDPTHAALNGERGGRLVLCAACRIAILRALFTGSAQTLSALIADARWTADMKDSLLFEEMTKAARDSLEESTR